MGLDLKREEKVNSELQEQLRNVDCAFEKEKVEFLSQKGLYLFNLFMDFLKTIKNNNNFYILSFTDALEKEIASLKEQSKNEKDSLNSEHKSEKGSTH